MLFFKRKVGNKEKKKINMKLCQKISKFSHFIDLEKNKTVGKFFEIYLNPQINI